MRFPIFLGLLIILLIPGLLIQPSAAGSVSVDISPSSGSAPLDVTYTADAALLPGTGGYDWTVSYTRYVDYMEKESYAFHQTTTNGHTTKEISNLDYGTWKFFTQVMHSNDVAFDESYIEVSETTNQPPVADAGSDQSVQVGTVVTLDGSNSYDPEDGNSITYEWSITSQPTDSNAQISDPSLVMPELIPDTVGDYICQLIVTDSQGAQSPPATVTIHATAEPYTVTFDKTLYTNIDQIGTLTIKDEARYPFWINEHFTVTINCNNEDHLLTKSKDIIVWEKDPGSRIFSQAFGFSDEIPTKDGYLPVYSSAPGYITVKYKDKEVRADYIFASVLRGQVWDMKIGQSPATGVTDIRPISGAMVKVSGENGYYTRTTNANGVFSVDTIAPGSYTVSTTFISPIDDKARTYSSQIDIPRGKLVWVELPTNILQIMKNSYKDQASRDYIRLRLAYVNALRTYTYTEFGLSIILTATTLPESGLEFVESLAKMGYDGGIKEIIFERLIRATDNEIENLQKGINDPPSSEYTEVYQLHAPDPIILPPDYTGNLTPEFVGLTNNLAQQAAIEDALLVSFERYQGALVANQPQYMKIQLDAIQDYSLLLEQINTPLQNDLNDILSDVQSNKQAHDTAIKDIQIRLNTTGFTDDEQQTLLDLGMNQTEIESYRQFLISFSFDDAITGLTDLKDFSQGRADTGKEMGNQSIAIRTFIDYPTVFVTPVANFTATTLTGKAPLNVSFTDLSLNNPSSWAWYFGDEIAKEPWTQVKANDLNWTPRKGHSSVAMPDGSIVVMGGNDNYGFKDDVWGSTDNGATWTRVNAGAGWTARLGHSSVVMSDGSIVLMGGDDGDSIKNDVWRSTDNGTTWTQMCASAGWTPRAWFSSVAMPDGSVVLMGGENDLDNTNDSWRSTDKGATWTRVNAGAGWTARSGHSSVAMPDGSIVLMGGWDGHAKNDTWRSTDNGATWTRVNAGAGWTARSGHSSVVMPDGSIILMGGRYSKNDVWRSTDKGATWTQVAASAGWSARCTHSSVVKPDGSIVLMGGMDIDGNYKDDVWRSTDKGATWTLMNMGHGWSPRIYHSSVAMLDGSVVLMGGVYLNEMSGNWNTKNDVWRSTNKGATWTQMNASAAWSGRQDHSSVAMPDGSIVLIGGYSRGSSGHGTYKNDVWRSTDNGATWTQMTASAGWSARRSQFCVAMPDDSIVLMGGYGGSDKNDVWRSTDNGATWIQMSENAGWTPRAWFSSVAMPDGSVVLMGGLDDYGYKNDVWRSTDNGATWTQMTASAGWSPRDTHTSVAMPDGSIIVMGGYGGGFKNDVWRSTDNGSTWIKMNENAGWTPRKGHSSVAMPDGSIVMMGGEPETFWALNDVWLFMPAGSSIQNPSHTYLLPGTYTVNLTVSNSFGSDTMVKSGYIVVTSAVLPLPGFTNPPTDPDGDGLYEDLNANNRKDFNDVVLMFNQMQWIAANEPVSAFDFNGNGRIDFNDIVKLFGEI